MNDRITTLGILVTLVAVVILGSFWLADKLDAKEDTATYFRSEITDQVNPTPIPILLNPNIRCRWKEERGINCSELHIDRTQDEIEDNARRFRPERAIKYISISYWLDK